MPTPIDNEFENILKDLELRVDEARIDFANKTYPTTLQILGVTNPHIKEVFKFARVRTEKWDKEDLKKLMTTLINSGVFECQLLAYEWIGRSNSFRKSFSSDQILRLNQNMDNWVLVDTYATLILGRAWNEEVITDEDIFELTSGNDIWQNRIAIAATVALNQKSKGGNGDVVRTLSICSIFTEDKRDLIVKAVSWSLRSLSDHYPEDVRKFVEDHRSVLHPRIIREVAKKLITGKKN